jgi:hypothetical protein
MATRSNALSEICCFWLQECKGLFIRESVPVKLQRNNSDIDFMVTAPAGPVTLLGEIKIKQAIVETKDERDFGSKGNDFAKRLLHDYEILKKYGINETKEHLCFSMLRKEHYCEATKIFGADVLFSKIFDLCK